MLTLYLLPGGTVSERTRSIESWSSVPLKIVELQQDRFDIHDPAIESWFAFMYGYEYLDEDLTFALPTLVRTEEYHFFVFYKKHIHKGEPLFTNSPRLFRSFVEMQKNCLLPCQYLERPSTVILDGWVRQDAVD